MEGGGAPATRACRDCQDVFCDHCYDAIHLNGKLATHTFDGFQNGADDDDDPAPHATTSAQATGVDVVADQGLAPAVAAPDHHQHLDEDWLEYWDDEYQAPYWMSTLTHQTTWDPPPSLAPTTANSLVARSYGTSATTPSAAAAHAGEWSEVFDEATGQNYFVNTRTQQTSWSLPIGDALATPAHADLAAAGVEDAGRNADDSDQWDHFFADDGTPYFVHRVTGESRWG
mmetsp:Transcript_14264/g.45709  ORF Transcript_14264/g.45709 Transcript_14264/m.45709 type:complete len:229 (+) Transcript_14264:2-688(+)